MCANQSNVQVKANPSASSGGTWEPCCCRCDEKGPFFSRAVGGMSAGGARGGGDPKNERRFFLCVLEKGTIETLRFFQTLCASAVFRELPLRSIPSLWQSVITAVLVPALRADMPIAADLAHVHALFAALPRLLAPPQLQLVAPHLLLVPRPPRPLVPPPRLALNREVLGRRPSSKECDWMCCLCR